MLVDQIERISNGELTATTDISQESAYYEYSQKLTNIGQGMEKALETQMKGERMKIDLITNVSHDLKTPLTSIIAYLSLLNEAPDMPVEQRAKYTGISLEKAKRLGELINEFFEITRYNLQNITLDKKEFYLYVLLEQVSGR